MTQQTTAERIRNLIFDAIQDSNHGEESTVAAPLGATIAAEIDTLTRERDALRATLNETMRQMGQFKAQAAEISGLTAQLRSADRSREATEDRLNALESALATAGIHPTEGDYAPAVDALTRERDEARAQAIEANANAAYAQTHEESLRIHKASLIKKLDATEKQLAEARAEVERLRPAAVGDGPIPDEDVLAWDGMSWHVAHHAYSRQTENDFLIDAEGFEDVDDNGVAWLKEGWYEIQESHDSDYDFLWSPIKRPITHWMRLPAAADRARAAKGKP